MPPLSSLQHLIALIDQASMPRKNDAPSDLVGYRDLAIFRVKTSRQYNDPLNSLKPGQHGVHPRYD